MTKKDRRHSGRRAPHNILKAKKQDIINECLEPQLHWDEWSDHRDGFRDWRSDNKKIKIMPVNEFNEEEHSKKEIMNRKLKKLLKIRKIRKRIKKWLTKKKSNTK